MTLIKNFDQYKGLAKVNEDVSKQEVKQIGTAPDDVARWKVILKSGSQNISTENPGPQIAEALVKDPSFINWWNSTSKPNAEIINKYSNVTADQKMSNSHLLPILYKVKEVDSNVFGNQVAKYEIGFKLYAMTSQAGKLVVLYDVTKAAPQVRDIKVGNSQIMFSAWNSDKLSTIKLETPVNTPEGMDPNLINPNSMSKGKAVSADMPKPSAQATVQQAAQAATASVATASGADYSGLKKSTAIDARVTDLQNRILSSGNEAAASLIRSKGGADGKFGDATASAIGVIVNNGTPVYDITQEIAAKLNPILAAITPTTTAQSTASTNKASVSKGTASKPKTQAASIKTPGGKTLSFE
jgi:hypothetical protein